MLWSAGVRPSAGGAWFRGFLIDLAAVFEAFVIDRLRAALGEDEAGLPPGERVLREKRLPLDDARRSFLAPDLSRWTPPGVSGRRRCVLIGDVKYRAIEQTSAFDADLKQALAYAVAAGLDDAWLVYATPGAADRGGGGVKTQTIRGRRIHRVGIDLDREPAEVLAGVEALAGRLEAGGQPPGAAGAGRSSASAYASSAASASIRFSERPASSSHSSRPLEEAPSTTAAREPDGELNS